MAEDFEKWPRFAGHREVGGVVVPVQRIGLYTEDDGTVWTVFKSCHDPRQFRFEAPDHEARTVSTQYGVLGWRFKKDPALLGMRVGVESLKYLNEYHGGAWFSDCNMEAFNTRVYDIHPAPDGWVFASSDRPRSGQRVYSVRHISHADGCVRKIGEYAPNLATAKRRAVKAAKVPYPSERLDA